MLSNRSVFNLEDFRTAAEEFMTTLTAKLREVGIPASSIQSDHLCFRVTTAEEYHRYKAALSNHGRLLTESVVNGRPISTFRLLSPIRTHCHEIHMIELPHPKHGTHYSTGFEHAEFLIKECFKSFQFRFPHLKFVEGGSPILNPELSLKFGQELQAKFHYRPLDRIIEIEESRISDIIFDLDGTLIKSREQIYEINRIVFSQVLDRDVSIQESIMNFHAEFSSLFRAFKLDCPKKKRDASALWANIASGFSFDLFDGVLETLSELKTSGFRLHLWTARDEQSARKVLRDHGIEDFFMTSSFATDSATKPESKSLCFNWQTVGKNRVIMIGDSPSDMIGAKNIGAIGGAALWDVHAKRSALVETDADLFFDTVEDFKNWMGRYVLSNPST